MITVLLSIDMKSASAHRTARTRRPSAGIADELLAAAAVEFAAHGFVGASTRRIAQRAGAHQPQINYHFASKELLWQATVDRLFAQLDPLTQDALAKTSDDPVAALDATVRAFLRFSAEHPELDRIINQEATAPSERLDWLLASHLRPRYEAVADLWGTIRVSGVGADLAPADVWELITGFGALHFANAPMLEGLGITSVDADAHADRLLALLIGGRGEPLTRVSRAPRTSGSGGR
jgi:AcrR family transcriptional regulator